MPIRLAPIDLSAATVGSKGTIDWRPATGGGYLAPTYKQTSAKQYAHLRFHNESGCGLDVTVPNNTDTDYIPAGGWGIFQLDDDVQYLNFTVSSIIPGAQVTVLKCVYYPANDQTAAPSQMILGNSPVGVSGLSSITIIGVNNWLIQTNASGELYFQNTTTGETYYMLAGSPGAFFFGDILAGAGGTTATQSALYYLASGSPPQLVITTPTDATGQPSTMLFTVVDAAGNVHFPLSLGANTSGSIQLDTGGHIISNAVIGPGIGSFPGGISSGSITGSDVRGFITLTTTAGGVPNGTVCAQVTFGTAYASTPRVFVQGYNAAQQWFQLASPSIFDLVNNGALAGSTTYQINYFVIG